jgi:NAD(P)-dependent dehydrogenase (short-subunit alcohol dehydrogenase family)
MININLTGTFLTCKHAVRTMIETSRGGSIVLTGSPTGIYGMALGQHAYSASKAGCHGLVRVMAAEYASENIRVNCVIPGFIDTPINERLLDDTQRLNRLVEKIPLRRAGSSDEVAGMYAWLASGDSSYVTGAFFYVDGGLTATV